jgi:hypothetical protein
MSKQKGHPRSVVCPYARRMVPSSSTRRTNTVAEIIPCFYIYNHKKQVLSKGQKPATFPANKAVTQKDRKRSIRQKRELTNPVRTGFEFVEYLNKNPSATYDDLSIDAGITKARVCQMIALCRRLPPEITEYLINTDESEILKHFTERKLRPLTLLASDEDKIKKFYEMREVLNSFR